jgi:hypothetical protein
MPWEKAHLTAADDRYAVPLPPRFPLPGFPIVSKWNKAGHTDSLSRFCQSRFCQARGVDLRLLLWFSRRLWSRAHHHACVGATNSDRPDAISD